MRERLAGEELRNWAAGWRKNIISGKLENYVEVHELIDPVLARGMCGTARFPWFGVAFDLRLLDELSIATLSYDTVCAMFSVRVIL